MGIFKLGGWLRRHEILLCKDKDKDQSCNPPYLCKRPDVVVHLGERQEDHYYPVLATSISIRHGVPSSVTSSLKGTKHTVIEEVIRHSPPTLA